MPILGGTGNASEYAYRSFLVYYPDPFDWVDITNATPGVEYRSGYAKITGIKSPLPLRVSIGSSYSLVGNVFDNGQTVTFDNNDVNQASFDEHTNPPERFKTSLGLNVINEYIGNNTSINLSKTILDTTTVGFANPYEVIVSVGKSIQDWIVTTKPLDRTPNSFAFNSISSVQTDLTVQSNSITLSGLEPNYTFNSQIISGIGTLYVNNVARGTNFDVKNGDIIKLELTSPNTFNSTSSLTYRVGTYTTSWTVTTETENLNIIFTPSDFVNQTDLQINTDYTSNQITLSGFSTNSALPVIFNGTNSSYEVERSGSIIKSFDSDPNDPIEVKSNDKIRIRQLSSNNYLTSIGSTIRVGNTVADWRITTTNPPPPSLVTFTLTRSSPFDNQITFTKQTGDGPNILTFGVIPDDSTETVQYLINPNATYLMTFASGTVNITSNTRISLNDSGGDSDFNDLIVSASLPGFYTSDNLIFYKI